MLAPGAPGQTATAWRTPRPAPGRSRARPHPRRCAALLDGRDLVEERFALLDTDAEFSTYAAAVGTGPAFHDYIAPNGMLIGGEPALTCGRESLRPDAGGPPGSLTWTPRLAQVAASGDLGFTVGVATVRRGEQLSNSKYLTIWKRQADGSWRYVADGGNDAPAPRPALSRHPFRCSHASPLAAEPAASRIAGATVGAVAPLGRVPGGCLVPAIGAVHGAGHRRRHSGDPGRCSCATSPASCRACCSRPASPAVALRFRFADGHRVASAAAHAIALPVFLFGGAALMGTFEWMVDGMPAGALLASVRRAELRYVAIDTVLYVLVVTATLTLQYGRESRVRAIRAARLQAQLAEAQLHALGAQLQPHFLFNTLHVISALVRHDPRRAEQLIARLSELLRELLDGNDRAEIPLRDELAFLEKYVDIQEARFGSRLQVTFDVAPSVLDATVPRLVLQPLVENAVRHGLARRREPTTVSVSARREQGALVLEVCDDGAGLSGGSVLREGVGLSTTRARLQQLYGGARHLPHRAGAAARHALYRSDSRRRGAGRHGGSSDRGRRGRHSAAAGQGSRRSRPRARLLMQPIRTIIVDDEPLARIRLRTLLAEHADFTVIAECGDGPEALAAIAGQRPDLVFLDVQMVEMDGVEVARAIERSASDGETPAVVFVTAFDRYALDAFSVHAVDYLLKPFDEERFVNALQRVRARRANADTREAHAKLLGVLRDLSRGELPGAGCGAEGRRNAPASRPGRGPSRAHGALRRLAGVAATEGVRPARGAAQAGRRGGVARRPAAGGVGLQ